MYHFKKYVFTFIIFIFLFSSFDTNAQDNVCGAVPLIYGANGPFSTVGATVEPGEPAPPGGACSSQIAWCDNNITNTLWFSFVAPASGRVQIQTPDFDTQLALWDAATCGAILTGGATLIAANDDDPDAIADEGVTYSSFLNPVNCLVPGKIYYVQLDPYGSPGGSTEVILNDIGPVDPAFSGLNATYCVTDSASDLIPVMTGGVFTGAGMSGNTFTPSAAGAGTFSIVYKLSNCDSMVHTVVVSGIPVANYTYSNVSSTYSFTNTSASALTYTWDFGDLSPVSNLTNPTHTFTANGVYYVQLIITNDCGADTVDHQIIVTGIAGIEEFSLEGAAIFPNPSDGAFNIRIGNAHFSQIDISITDVQGRTVYSASDKSNAVNYTRKLDLKYLAKGIYYLRLSTEKGLRIQKLIIE